MPVGGVGVYEKLRGDVLLGQARPDGLGAIVFHGMWQGLLVLSRPAPVLRSVDPLPSRPASAAVAHDRELVRMLANMMLSTESEARYVY